jgi:alpha-L-rhamnosidase
MLTNPEGIDVLTPRLSWEILGEERNIRQTGYQILVTSSLENLEKDSGDVWDSGMVNSDHSIHIRYAGIPLKKSTKVYWKVKVWSNQGRSDWSSPAWWSTGLVQYKDWQGRWIGFDYTFPGEKVEEHSRLSARYFRKEFEISKEVKCATAYIMGLGLYELYVNGQKIGNHVLAPAPTDYTKNVKYNTFNVTDFLVSNQKNAIGVILGNGRYFGARILHKAYKIKTFGFPKLLLNLLIEYTDGTKEVIQTDNQWKGTADGPIISNNEYDGEEYDARKEMPGWSQAGFDDSNWLQAEYVQEPRGEFEAQMNENQRVMKTIAPLSITRKSPNRYIVDFGQNMAGWVQLKAKGKRGHCTILKFAEILDENGELFTANLRGARMTDKYIFKGSDKEEIWEPRFVYHGFQFIEVIDFPGKPVKDNFLAKVVYDDIKTVGHFECSNQIINQIFKNSWWAIASNYKGMPIDCPQRNERQPWLGDRGIGCHGENFIFDNGRLYAKCLDDIRYSQRRSGSLTDVAPPFFRYYSDNMTWPGTFLLAADMLYRQNGDVDVIRKNYPAMKKWIFYMKDRYMDDDFILTKDSYGDWCSPPNNIEVERGKSANVKRPSALISTAYFYHFMKRMEQFADLTGYTSDIHSYQSLAEQVYHGFNKRFLNDEKTFYGDSSLTEQLLPLYFKLVPQKYEDGIFKTIEQIIEVENNGHLSTGLIGVQWLLRTLTENGRTDLAWQLATNTTYPSWGYMIENGATAIWELWHGNVASPAMNSYNHVMLLGDFNVWLFENLAGIKTDPNYPGFKRIIMKPSFVAGLDSVKASFHSMHGFIQSHWVKQKEQITWKITIPANTDALVYFSTSSRKNISEMGNFIGCEYYRSLNNQVVYQVASGKYEFRFNLN